MGFDVTLVLSDIIIEYLGYLSLWTIPVPNPAANDLFYEVRMPNGNCVSHKCPRVMVTLNNRTLGSSGRRCLIFSAGEPFVVVHSSVRHP
jgi:hypothetical protein